MNTKNLIKEQETGGLVISQNYNLLNNDGIGVIWEGQNVKLLKPYGLSKLTEIRFRNFKGDLLPFTQLTLPDLDVSVVINSNVEPTDLLNSSVEGKIYGTDSVFGDIATYAPADDKKTLLNFKKAWTYDNTNDLQIDYNIQEAIKEANERMKILYPIMGYTYSYGLNDYTNTYDYADDSFIPNQINAGSYAMGYLADNMAVSMLKLYFVDSGVKQLIPLYTGAVQRKIWDAISFDKSQRVLVTSLITGGRVSLQILGNTGTSQTPSYNLPSLFWKEKKGMTSVNRFMSFLGNDCINAVFGNIGGTTYTCVAPMDSRTSGADTITKSRCLSFSDTNRALYCKINDYIGYDCVILAFGSEENNVYVLTASPGVYDTSKYKYNVFVIPMSNLSTDYNAAINTPPTYESIDEYAMDTWTEQQQFMLFGKESYGIRVFSDSLNNKVLHFIGSYAVCINSQGRIYKVNPIIGYKINTMDDYVLQCKGSSSYYKGSSPYYMGYLSYGDLEEELATYDDALLVAMDGGFMSNTILWNRVCPVYLFGNDAGCWAAENFKLDIVEDLTRNDYLGRGEQKNAFQASQKIKLNMAASLKLNDTTHQLINTADGLVTTDTPDFFSVNNRGELLTSQLVFDNNKDLNLSIVVQTNPYMFMYSSPVEYYTSSTYSLVHPISKPTFRQINTHVLNTIESLILLLYEFNDLSIRCPTFPNTDGIVFNINEESKVDFKIMAVNNTIDALTIQIISDGEPVDIESLKRLYGKLTLSVDWCQ